MWVSGLTPSFKTVRVQMRGARRMCSKKFRTKSFAQKFREKFRLRSRITNHISKSTKTDLKASAGTCTSYSTRTDAWNLRPVSEYSGNGRTRPLSRPRRD